MQSTTTKGQEWWRWPVMPFAAIGGALVGSYILTLLQYLGLKLQGGFRDDGWMLLYILPMMTCGIFGYIYAYIACVVSPKAKFTAGVAMTVALGVAWTGLVIFGWNSPSFTEKQAITETCRLVAVVVGAVIALAGQLDELRMAEIRNHG